MQEGGGRRGGGERWDEMPRTLRCLKLTALSFAEGQFIVVVGPAQREDQPGPLLP